MQERALGRRSLESDFRESIGLQHVELCRALKSQQFEVHYQPQVALADGRLTGFEALLRWNHPERGLVTPDQFIPLAEETGLIDLLGEWVLRTACREAAAWPVSDTGIPLRVAVNISPLQLRERRALLDMIENAIGESGLPVGRLELELTETALAGDIGDTLSDIRTLGADLALDDFGTGYSSLSRLHCHPFNRLKIDQSFVTDLGQEGESKAHHTSEWMVRAIASLGLGLGLETVIEGIETPHQRDVARQAGCTEMQGYLVSRPVPDTDVADLVSRLAALSNRKTLTDGN
jgi:EAL domain-containing protein (putative c-di-GMP-specific phosphodiesterase class I)